MKSRWTKAGARDAIERFGEHHGEDLALRVYTSRLIGSDANLVLHGGGNTSLKGTRTTLLGEVVDVLFVKRSGTSLDAVGPRDLPGLDLGGLRRLRGLDRLSDEEMENQLRTHLLDASSPNPSVETLLHAFLTHRFVDHSHADSVLTLTNQPEGEALVREALAERVVVIPYIMPGLPLAKAVAEAVERQPGVQGAVRRRPHQLRASHRVRRPLRTVLGAQGKESPAPHRAPRVDGERLTGSTGRSDGPDPARATRREDR